MANVVIRAVVIAALTVAVAACTNSPDSGSNPTSAAASIAEAAPTTRKTCEVAVPAAWQTAIDAGGVHTGGVSNVPMVVDRAGQVAVARDNGDTRDVLLIGADKSVNEIYAVPEPNRNWVGSVAMDDRWVVVGVEYAPRGANGTIPTLMRIDVVDRQGGPVRTVVESPMEDRDVRRQDHRLCSPCSAARCTGSPGTPTPATPAPSRSYDLNTGAVTDAASGDMRNVRTTAAGLSWEVAWDQNAGTRAELKIPDALPPPVAGALGTGRDQLTLATDGTAYAWFTENDQGQPGLAYWSPTTGLVRITGTIPQAGKFAPTPLYVVGPFAVIDRGRQDDKHDTDATVVDTRSGALTYLRPTVGGANGGTIAVGIGATLKDLPTSAGVLRVDVLPPLSC